MIASFISKNKLLKFFKFVKTFYFRQRGQSTMRCIWQCACSKFKNVKAASFFIYLLYGTINIKRLTFFGCTLKTNFEITSGCTLKTNFKVEADNVKKKTLCQ